MPCGEKGSPLEPDCIPYITHPLGVMAILARCGASPELLAAALLHDYLEDVDDPSGEEHILSACGPEVLELVMAVTEDKRRESPAKETWKERKAEGHQHLKQLPGDAVRLKAADFLHNLLSLIADLEATGNPEDVWGRFNAGREDQFRYFNGLLEVTTEKLGEKDAIVSSIRKNMNKLRNFTNAVIPV